MLYKKLITILRSFVRQYFPYLKPYVYNKLQARLAECIFLWYDAKQKKYMRFDCITKKFYTNHHVDFNEFCQPYKVGFYLCSFSIISTHSTSTLYVPRCLTSPNVPTDLIPSVAFDSMPFCQLLCHLSTFLAIMLHTMSMCHQLSQLFYLILFWN